MSFKLRKNLTSGIISIIFGIILWIMIPLQIKSRVVTGSSAVGPDFFPKIIAVLLFGLGIGLVLQSIISKKDDIIEIKLSEEARVLTIFAVILVYILLMPKLSYVITTPLFACGCLALTKDKNWKHYVGVLILVVAVFCLFRYVLHVSLPEGILKNIIK